MGASGRILTRFAVAGGDTDPLVADGGHPLIVHLCGTVICLLALALPTSAQEGYRMLADQLVVNTQADWEAWVSPTGVRVVVADGTVEPRFLRRNMNAALDASRFRYVSEGDTLTGGILAAGSNRTQADLVIDGDDGSWWEPAPGAPVDGWWIDIDLGRVVVVSRLVVRFAESGDPFLKFRVLISDGRTTFTATRQREFHRVGLVNLPNKTQREFVFDVEPRLLGQPELEGDIAQIIRIQALDSDGPQGAEVDAEVYAALPEQERGAIDHYRRTSAGRQIRVDEEIYDALPAVERGDIHHFRRERPRLAEVEVYALGDNVARLTRPPLETKRLTPDQLRTRPFTDGLYATSGFLREYDAVRDKNQIVFDLGARYWLDRIRLLSPSDPPLTYQLRLSDGSVNPDGELVWRPFDYRLNGEGFLQLEEAFDLREVRYIDLRRLELLGGTQGHAQLVAEVQALGEGYASEVVMASPMLQLGRSRLFTTVEWDGQTPLGTRIEVRTRTGDEIITVPHYFTPAGSEISQVTWERRDVSKRGPVVIEQLPGADWSEWSEVYLKSGGEPFKSLAPRRNALIEARLLSGQPLRAASLRELRLRFASPLAESAFAELMPVRVEPGREVDFTLYLMPRFVARNPGFDRVRLRSSSIAPLTLVSVRTGSEQALQLGGGTSLWPGTLQLESGPEEGELDLVFPAPVRQGSPLYAITFRTQVYVGNTQFSAHLLLTDLPTRVQQVSAGEATSLSQSQSLVAVADLGDARLLDAVTVLPAVLTPNGDGVNDEVTIQATVFVIEGDKRLRVEIFDLSGRRVRDLSTVAARPSGPHRVPWDGRDEGRRLVPPGIYLVRLGIDTDAGEPGTEAVRLVHVAY